MIQKLATIGTLLAAIQVVAFSASFESDKYFSISYSSASLWDKSDLSKVSLTTTFSEATFGHKLFDVTVAVYYDDDRAHSIGFTIRPAAGFTFPNDRSLRVLSAPIAIVLDQPAAFDLLYFESQIESDIRVILSGTSLQFADANENKFLVETSQWQLFKSVVSAVIGSP